MGLIGWLSALGKLKHGEISVMPPQGQSGFSGYSGKSGFSGFSGKQGLNGQTGIGLSGWSGYSGFSGPQGPQGIQGIPGTPGGGSLPTPSDNLALTGSLTTGVGSGKTGDVAFVGSSSGAVHLTVESDAGTGIFILPNTTGTHTLATLADIQALRQELGLP
jgi:hypothetical protein